MSGDDRGQDPLRRPEATRIEAIQERIARALGFDVPELEASGHSPDGKIECLRESIELLRLFETIGDARTRRECLAFVRAAASG